MLFKCDRRAILLALSLHSAQVRLSIRLERKLWMEEMLVPVSLLLYVYRYFS